GPRGMHRGARDESPGPGRLQRNPAMPRRPLPLFTLVLGLVAVYLGFTGPRQARAEGPPDAKGAVTVEVPAPEFQKVRVAPADRGTPAIEGTLRLSAIPLLTAVGAQVIHTTHLLR